MARVGSTQTDEISVEGKQQLEMMFRENGRVKIGEKALSLENSP